MTSLRSVISAGAATAAVLLGAAGCGDDNSCPRTDSAGLQAGADGLSATADAESVGSTNSGGSASARRLGTGGDDPVGAAGEDGDQQGTSGQGGDPETDRSFTGSGGSSSAAGGATGGGGTSSSNAGGGTSSNTGGTRAGTGGASSNVGGTAPNTGGASSNVGGTASDTGGTSSDTGGTDSNTGGTDSNTGGTDSNTGGTDSNTGGTASGTGGTEELDPIVPKAMPSWVGAGLHEWTPRLGGVAWLPNVGFWREAVRVFPEYPRPVLVGLKTNCRGFGYRFDMNSWDEREESSSWYSGNGDDRAATAEDIIGIAEQSGNAEFVFHVPMPRYLVDGDPNAASEEGSGYSWQTVEFYGAMVQYLFGQADAESEWGSLPASLDFFDEPSDFNWANLRAKRGRTEPYPVVAVILGQEPYYIEGWADDGAAWGAYAERLRVQIRDRGVSVPLGFHVRDSGPPSDGERTWFRPLMNALDYEDFDFIDLHHYYLFDGENDNYRRVFPVAINDSGFQNYWVDSSTWLVDYTKYMWLVDDTRAAFQELGFGSADRFNLGFGEHGLAITSNFKYNDMMAGISWAAWLAEGMRLNTKWDVAWVLAEEGWSNAQIQIRDGNTTRTPAFYVYQMAQEFYGYQLLDSNFPTELGDVTLNDGSTLQYPLAVVRVFQNPNDLRIHLFAVNMSETAEATIAGFEGWSVREWKQLHGDSLDAMNPIGDPWTEETVRTQVIAGPASGEPLVVAPISVNHIVLE